jgi:hypothetical protein
MILASHGIIASQISQFVGLLDTYSGASAAYSLRRLSGAYSGKAIRVRRASDNTEQDIGFTLLGDLDTTSLTTFCSGTNGFVKTWYDQSNNGKNITQATAANQPQIVSSGTIILENGKSAIDFDGSNDILSLAQNVFLTNQSRSLITVYKPDNATGTFAYVIAGQQIPDSNGAWTSILCRTSGVTGDPYFAGFAQDLGNLLTTPNTLQKLANFYYNGTAGYLYKNNSLIESANLSLSAGSTGNIMVGGRVSAAGGQFAFFNGKIQEVIFWGNNQLANNRWHYAVSNAEFGSKQ